jgi:hypothetical protein
MAYLAMHSSSRTMTLIWLMNNEMERIWKVPVVNYFNVPSTCFIEVSEQKYKFFSQDNQYEHRKLNPRPPNYVSGLLPAQPCLMVLQTTFSQVITRLF